MAARGSCWRSVHGPFRCHIGFGPLVEAAGRAARSRPKSRSLPQVHGFRLGDNRPFLLQFQFFGHTGSLARRSRSAAVSRDFPIPASPHASTTWPSPVFALDQRRSSNSVSSSRPMKAVSPVARSASKRLSTDLAHRAAHARTGPAMPLRSLDPRSSARRDCRGVVACPRR
jgi:hypothetical protein